MEDEEKRDHDCVGNPVDDDKHKNDIRKSVEKIKSLINSSIPVVGVFVKRSQTDPNIWEAEDLVTVWK